MVDNRPIIDQFHELQRMYANMKIHDISLDEFFIVSSIINKLPPPWRDVRHALKLKKKDISLTNLGKNFVHESKGINMVEGKTSQGGKQKNISRGIQAKRNPLKMGVGNTESPDI